MKTLIKGTKGEDVKILQLILGITCDGDFGGKTEQAVKNWQSLHNLTVDGIVGPKTWNALINSKVVSKDVIYSPLTINISRIPKRKIKYIAIHYTASTNSEKGCAGRVKNVFKKRKASADFCVDDEEILQFNPDLNNYYCWAVGDNKNKFTNGGSLYQQATNKNTISIEICSSLKEGTSQMPNHKGWYYSEEVLNLTLKLVKILMNKFNIPIDKVVRHYDISGKLCPGIVGWNNGSLYNTNGKLINELNNSERWNEFKEKLRDNEFY